MNAYKIGLDLSDKKTALVWLKTVTGEDVFPLTDPEGLKTLLENSEDLVETARTVLRQKIGMPSLKLGDLTIEPPQKYFETLLKNLEGLTLDKNRLHKKGMFYSKRRSDGT